jgi:MFS family permease
MPDMIAPSRAASPITVALAGLTAIAVAMGIGRFAFTPILPMMQQDAGLSVAGGAWLASANYFGFLLGAVWGISLRIPHTILVRWSLVVIGVVTLWMGFEHRFWVWLVLCALAGIANAWAQIFAFAWCMEILAAVRRPLLNSVVFAGVGTGIAIAGGFCLVLMQANAGSAQAWIGLGLLSLVATIFIWRTFGIDKDATVEKNYQAATQAKLWHADSLRLVICFGASGFGYIIPATFLPVMARQLIPDPLVFGWSWPLFGIAAALAPLATAGLARLLGDRRLWMSSHLVMALAVALPVWWSAIGGIMISALLVGSTFMINAMTSMQEARTVGGAHATSLMAAMIAAFAAGQIIGPVSVSYLVGADADFSIPLLIASFILVASAYALSLRRRV